jgi:hypothetical protein
VTERIAVGLFITLAATFIIALFTLTGCVKAKGIEQTSGRDSEMNALKAQIDDLKVQLQSTIKAGGDVAALKLKLDAQIAALDAEITTSAPIDQTGDNATANQNNAAVVLQYTGAGIGGAAVLGLWLRFMRRNNTEERAKEIKLAEIDAANDKHTMDTMAGLRDCQFRPPCDKKE